MTESTTGPLRDTAGFHAWAFGDLRSNVLRRVIAEWLVAVACDPYDQQRTPRAAWAPWDLQTSDGITIEVKSVAEVQAWVTEAPAPLTYSGLLAHRWDESTRTYSSEPAVVADVYVFARNTAESEHDYDPFDPEQWDFRVRTGRWIRELGQKSLRHAVLERSTPRCPWDGLPAAIRVASADVRPTSKPA